MQLLQNYGMVSWTLPEGCNIVLTGNPDEQDYLVTTIDSAILTRIKHITLVPDVKEWAIWAENHNLDTRGISYVLTYPEMINGKERTNLRTLSEFFRALKVLDYKLPDNKKEIEVLGNSLLDEETVNSFMVFCIREVELIVEPEDILSGKQGIKEHIKDLMTRKEPRIDIVNIICERLFVRMVQDSCRQNANRIKNFHDFITYDLIPDDIRHSLCRRITHYKNGKYVKWILNCKKLQELILANFQ